MPFSSAVLEIVEQFHPRDEVPLRRIRAAVRGIDHAKGLLRPQRPPAAKTSPAIRFFMVHSRMPGRIPAHPGRVTRRQPWSSKRSLVGLACFPCRNSDEALIRPPRWDGSRSSWAATELGSARQMIPDRPYLQLAPQHWRASPNTDGT